MNPYVGSGTTKREHTRVAERALGKPLPVGAVIHHVDGNGKNNKNNNLVICPSQKYHALLHTRTASLAATGITESRRCKFCKEWFDIRDTVLGGTSNPARGDKEFFHRACINTYNAARREQLRTAGKRWW